MDRLQGGRARNNLRAQALRQPVEQCRASRQDDGTRQDSARSRVAGGQCSCSQGLNGGPVDATARRVEEDLGGPVCARQGRKITHSTRWMGVLFPAAKMKEVPRDPYLAHLLCLPHSPLPFALPPPSPFLVPPVVANNRHSTPRLRVEPSGSSTSQCGDAAAKAIFVERERSTCSGVTEHARSEEHSAGVGSGGIEGRAGEGVGWGCKQDENCGNVTDRQATRTKRRQNVGTIPDTWDTFLGAEWLLSSGPVGP